MSIARFQQELSGQMPAPAYVLYASDEFLLYTALSEIRDTFHGTDSFNFEVHDIESPDGPVRMEEIVDTLNTLPFMSSRRVVVIRNSQKLTKKGLSALEAYAESPAPSSLLVLLHLGTKEKLGSLTEKKHVRVIGLDVPAREIPSWLKRQAKHKGVTVTDGAIDYLIGTVGTDLGLLSSELDKCALWDVQTVDVDALKEITFVGIEFSAFDLIEALKRRDAASVFRIYEHLSRAVEPQMLLGALNWHYARLSGRSQQERGIGDGGYAEVFRALHEADAAVKTSRSYAIETLLMQLLQVTPR